MSKVLSVPASVLVLATAVALGLGAATPPAAGEDLGTEKWVEDIDFLTTRLRELHPAPFTYADEEAWNAQVQGLRQRLPEMSDTEIVVELRRLLAQLQDGHTVLHSAGSALEPDGVFPVRIESFEEGFFLTAVAEEDARFAGAQVVAFGTNSIESAAEIGGQIVSADSGYQRIRLLPVVFANAGWMEVLGLADDGQLDLALELPDGRRVRHRIPSRAPSGPSPWLYRSEHGPAGASHLARDLSQPTPLHLRRREAPYWFEHLPKEKLVWLQFNQVQDGGDETFAQLCERMFRLIEEQGVERLVVDLRHNGGGRAETALTLVHGIIAHPRINQRGRLFAVTGGKTFSAAIHTSAWLEWHTEVTFVGEPTGAGPNHFGDPAGITLPKSGLRVRISDWRWQLGYPWDTRRAIVPHLPVPPRFADYAAGTDAVLEAILRHGREPDLATLLRRGLEAGAADGALSQIVEEFRATHGEHYGRTHESSINTLGYRLLQEGDLPGALRIFTLNTELYPQSANTFDSLGEALAIRGDREAAIEQYLKALVLDPNLPSATEALRRLEGE